jgi:hypothetical protein
MDLNLNFVNLSWSHFGAFRVFNIVFLLGVNECIMGLHSPTNLGINRFLYA